MTNPRRPFAILLSSALLVATACGSGGGDQSSDAAPSPPASAAGVGDEAPDATVSPDLPPEFAGQVGPVQVIGDPLPLHTAESDDPVDADPAVGMTAPILVGQAFDGTAIRVDPAANGPTMLVFLAHWCPHCNDEMPRLNDLRDAGRFPADLNIVAVSTAVDPSRPNFPPSQWVVDKDWTYPTIADGIDVQREELIAATAYGLSGFPFVTLIDGQGVVRARWSGEREEDEVIALITANLGLD